MYAKSTPAKINRNRVFDDRFEVSCGVTSPIKKVEEKLERSIFGSYKNGYSCSSAYRASRCLIYMRNAITPVRFPRLPISVYTERYIYISRRGGHDVVYMNRCAILRGCVYATLAAYRALYAIDRPTCRLGICLYSYVLVICICHSVNGQTDIRCLFLEWVYSALKTKQIGDAEGRYTYRVRY